VNTVIHALAIDLRPSSGCCLDSIQVRIKMPLMRTTVTIDPDTEMLLKEEVRRTGRPFKEVLNLAVRRALAQTSPAGKPKVEPLFPCAFPAELEASGFNKLADALDDDETFKELHR
jgi:hypothetical protein